MNAVDIKNLKFSYSNVEVFDGLTLSIDKGDFVTILGKGGSGKSTLFKILSGKFQYYGAILMLNKDLNYNLEQGYLGLVSADIYNFKEKKVIDELTRVLKEKGRTSDKISAEIKRAVKKTGISELLDFNIKDLDLKDRILIMFTIQILKKPKILILDNVLEYLDNDKAKIVREISQLNKKNVTIINITNVSEESIYGKNVIFLDDEINKINVNDLEEDDFIRNNLEVPFMISLSSKLKFYDLIKDNYFNMEKLVDDLWQ